MHSLDNSLLVYWEALNTVSATQRAQGESLKSLEASIRDGKTPRQSIPDLLQTGSTKVSSDSPQIGEGPRKSSGDESPLEISDGLLDGEAEQKDKARESQPEPEDAADRLDAQKSDDAGEPQQSLFSRFCKSRTAFDSHRNPHYTISNSAWDAMIFIGSKDLHMIDAVAIFGAFISNVVLQILISYTVWAGFVDPQLPDPEIIQSWREVDGHSYDFYTGASDESLVSRVCKIDESLSVASNLVSMLHEIEMYEHRNTGPTLAYVCLLVWALFLAKEFEEIARSVACFFDKYDGKPRTVIRKEADGQYVIVSIGFGRLVILTIIAGVRLVVVTSLLSSGGLWLLRTVHIADLVLNVVALAFVLEIDEIVALQLLPWSVHNLCDNTMPLECENRVARWAEAMVDKFPHVVITPGLLVMFFTTIAFLAEMVPLISLMDDIKSTMCGDPQNFVVLTNTETLLPYVTTSTDTGDGAVSSTTKGEANRLVVREILDNTVPKYGISYKDEGLMRIEASQGVEGFHRIYEKCYDVYYGEGWDKTLSNVALQSGLDSERGPCAIDQEEGRGPCNDPNMVSLRATCPALCRCHDPRGGLFLDGTMYGCPPAELCEEAYNTTQIASCQDLSPQDLALTPSWLAYWTNFNRYTINVWGTSGVNLSLVAEIGCEIVPRGNLSLVCSGNAAWSSVAGFCPATCECNKHKSESSDSSSHKKWFCPESCMKCSDNPAWYDAFFYKCVDWYGKCHLDALVKSCPVPVATPFDNMAPDCQVGGYGPNSEGRYFSASHMADVRSHCPDACSSHAAECSKS